jgi:hypothetical protein
MLTASGGMKKRRKESAVISFGWWLVCWLIAGSWFVLREKYCWLVADKPDEQECAMWACTCLHFTARTAFRFVSVNCLLFFEIRKLFTVHAMPGRNVEALIFFYNYVAALN